MLYMREAVNASMIRALLCFDLPALCARTKVLVPSLVQSTPDRTRTCDLRIRNPLLYPAELRELEVC